MSCKAGVRQTASSPSNPESARKAAPRLCRALLLSVISISLAWSAAAAAAHPRAPGKAWKSGIIGYVPGRILVQPRAGLEDRDLDDLAGRHGGRRKGKLKGLDVHVIELDDHANTEAALRLLAKNPNLKFAELDMIVAPTQIPSDPTFPSQWHLPKISAPDAWNNAAGDGVTIAILDTGVDGAHPDLAPVLVPGWNFYDNNSNTSDVQGHGTAVAGAAAAAGNNGIGVSGVTWRARIMPIRIADPSAYATFSRMASGITYAANNGARVANISYSGASGSLTVQNAASYMRSRGGVVVVSAENTGTRLSYTESPTITSVAATTSSDTKASFSSYGAYVDVAAPGVSIYTTTRGGGYGAMSGTSVSAPIVAGVYALMMSANPALSPGELDSVLQVTVTDIGTAGFDEYFGYGRVNAAAAVQMARNSGAPDGQAPLVSLLTPAGGARVAGAVAVDVSAIDNVGVSRVELYANGSLVATDNQPPYAFLWDTSGLADGVATLQAKAFDAAGNVGDSGGVGVTVANDQEPPTVAFANPSDGGAVSGTVYVIVSAADNNRVSKTTLAIDGKVVAATTGSSLTYAWSGVSIRGRTRTPLVGSFVLTATAEDPSGNASGHSISVIRR